MIQQLPKLSHLEPPASASELGLVRYSPLFNDPSLGVEEKHPTRDCGWIYAGLADDNVTVMAEVFESGTPLGEAEMLADRIAPLIDEWRLRRMDTYLIETVEPDGTIRIDRTGPAARHWWWQEPWEIEVWNLLRDGKTAAGIQRYQDSLAPPDAVRVGDLLCRLDGEGLVYRDEGTYLTLPTR